MCILLFSKIIRDNKSLLQLLISNHLLTGDAALWMVRLASLMLSLTSCSSTCRNGGSTCISKHRAQICYTIVNKVGVDIAQYPVHWTV